MFTDKLVKAVDKSTEPRGYDSFLVWTWVSDSTRGWDTVYSRKPFVRFWDDRNIVDAEVRSK